MGRTGERVPQSCVSRIFDGEKREEATVRDKQLQDVCVIEGRWRSSGQNLSGIADKGSCPSRSFVASRRWRPQLISSINNSCSDGNGASLSSAPRHLEVEIHYMFHLPASFISSSFSPPVFSLGNKVSH